MQRNGLPERPCLSKRERAAAKCFSVFVFVCLSNIYIYSCPFSAVCRREHAYNLPPRSAPKVRVTLTACTCKPSKNPLPVELCNREGRAGAQRDRRLCGDLSIRLSQNGYGRKLDSEGHATRPPLQLRAASPTFIRTPDSSDSGRTFQP